MFTQVIECTCLQSTFVNLSYFLNNSDVFVTVDQKAEISEDIKPVEQKSLQGALCDETFPTEKLFRYHLKKHSEENTKERAINGFSSLPEGK